MPPLKGLAAGSSRQSLGISWHVPDTLLTVNSVDYCSHRDLMFWKNLKLVTQAVHTAKRTITGYTETQHEVLQVEYPTIVCFTNFVLWNNKWCLFPLVIKEDPRIPRSFQKCKTGSAVKDVEAAAFPWEAANLEVEYGLVSSGAAARAAQAVWWGTSFAHHSEALQLSHSENHSWKNFVQNYQADLHLLYTLNFTGYWIKMNEYLM